MPSSLRLAIGKERRPSPADRRQMIRVIVDEQRKSEANPTRLGGQKWMVGIEGHVICEGVQPTFSSGLAALFACYYNFNLQYQEDATFTLEFMQR
ncbi:hypothetical protein NFI96_011478 [Prochilodus magdalenae]|nr:hypothetical protein NFI96_011478 [Prochilodus magdalenae]